jgi:hypothetical protein
VYSSETAGSQEVLGFPAQLLLVPKGFPWAMWGTDRIGEYRNQAGLLGKEGGKTTVVSRFFPPLIQKPIA